jgi:hypothetical protein
MFILAFASSIIFLLSDRVRAGIFVLIVLILAVESDMETLVLINKYASGNKVCRRLARDLTSYL